MRNLIALTPYRFRLGSTFFEWYRRFEAAEKWVPEQVIEYQQTLLASLLRDLKMSHPVYQQLLDGLDPVKVAQDPKRWLPIMSRDDFRFRSPHPELAKRLSPASTSGTAGNALQFFHDAEDDQREWAAICYQWRRVGFDPLTSRRAEFRGLVPNGKLLQKFPEHNMLRCSILDFKPECVRYYARTCKDWGVEFLHGYPSALDLLARTCVQEGIHFEGVRGIMLASEMVYPHQVEIIEQAFPNARLIAHYGNTERVALGSWCESERTYHMLPLYSLVEVDPSDGSLIGTNLFNRVNPFIRYQMSDRVVLSDEAVCHTCGRFSAPMVVSVEGRAEDYLFSPVRGWIPPAIITYPLKNLQVVREIQLYQRQPDLVELRYCTYGNADASGEVAEIAQGLSHILAGVRIVTLPMDSLPRGATGKFRWIISELDPHSLSI